MANQVTDALRQSVGKVAPKALRNFGGGFLLGYTAGLLTPVISERADSALDGARAWLRGALGKFGGGKA